MWGTLDHSDMEKIQLKYCKYILNINNSTPSVMIYGELGIYPLEIEIICGIVGLWFSIISGKQSKLSYVMYQMLTDCIIMRYIHHHGSCTSKIFLTNVGCQISG